ncbi:uncharacterized protein LOC135702693, partial [Ochlerotatus camptorhynchus]|uniref:uncharacterized protein LOC135702693 n=1 Tax=Ochlerotatus camptorhynchus TaxID=644619 RepID=UPI0031DB3BF8
LRRQMSRKVNRYLVAFQCVTTLNSCIWALTSGLHEDIFKIPFPMDGLPDVLKQAVDLGFAILLIPWCFTIWHSTTLFVPMLSILHTELAIIVGQFDGLFEKVVANYALEPNDLDRVSTIQRSRFWAELDMTFKTAISHHSAFISNLQLLRNISSLNFFIFLCSSALVITFNIFPSITYPSLEHLPLLLLALQYVTEAYLCCTMFDNLENENNRIANHVYVIDWLYSVGKSSKLDQAHCKSILQNALILNRQINAGLAIQAGGIFPLKLMTFTQMIKSVYSLLTMMVQSVA